IFIPRWRLDAQKLFRQKNLTLKRIKALQKLVEEDDAMKEDVEIVYARYEKKLQDLEDKEKSINEKLIARLDELNKSTKSIKSILFDAKLQYRSNEITEETYLQVTRYTKELMDHINLEKEEINSIKIRLEEQNLENTLPLPHSIPQQHETEEQKEKLIENTYTNTNLITSSTDTTPTTTTIDTTNTVSTTTNIPTTDLTTDTKDTKEPEQFKQVSTNTQPESYTKQNKERYYSTTNDTDNETNWLDQVINS
ncbi:MAG: CdvA-like protein, partial [Nitrososphaerales archaeon]